MSLARDPSGRTTAGIKTARACRFFKMIKEGGRMTMSGNKI